ncbi:MAG TPA: ABC-2 family transporter protein [Ilumatobacteraceae bacterium]|nr:ABC-2 family transporter protein [Ilumatobacteraceae bacterium]
MLRVWRALWRVRVLHELHYRANLAMNLVQVAIDLAIGAVAIKLVFANIDDLHGWDEDGLLVVLGIYTMIDAFVRAVVLPNMFALVEDVRDGNFDGVLVMPADAQVFVTARELSVWDLPGLALGAVVVVVGAVRQGGIGPAEVGLFVVTFPFGLAIIYGFFLAVTSLVFRLIDLRDLLFRLFQGSSSGRWPLGIYPGWLRVVLTVVVPMAVAVTVPASALTGRLGAAQVGLAVLAAVVVLTVSRWLFRRGLRSYAGASA